MPDFIHIDIAADDPERAARFYANVFDWNIQKLPGEMPYWLFATGSDGGAGIGGGIGQREADWQGVTATIGVTSAQEFASKIEAEGGTIIAPATLVPGVGHLVVFKDTEGNVLAILEPLAEGIMSQPAPPAA